MADLAKQKKLLMPFLDRATQVEQVSPVVAYYTRLAGIIRVMKLKPLAPDIEGILSALMAKLEGDKVKLQLAKEGDKEGKVQELEKLKEFAIMVFAKADQADQLGVHDATTIKRYMSARVFLQVLETARAPSGLEDKEAEIMQFCSFRAAQISKALKSGEAVPPPPAGADPAPGGDLDLDAELAAIEGPSEAKPAGAAGPAASGGGPAQPPATAAQPQPPPPPPPAAAQAPKPLPSIFTVGSHILFRKSAAELPVPGRIIKAKPTAATITTPTSTEEATPDQLAPLLPPGSEVTVRSDGPTGDLPATVTHELSGNEWPPVYVLQTSQGPQQATHAQFVCIAPPRVPSGAAERPPVAALPQPPMSTGYAHPPANQGQPGYGSGPGGMAPQLAHPPAHPGLAQPAPPVPARPAAKVTKQKKEAAKKACKTAISALNFDDVQSAVDSLQQALRELCEP